MNERGLYSSFGLVGVITVWDGVLYCFEANRESWLRWCLDFRCSVRDCSENPHHFGHEEHKKTISWRFGLILQMLRCSRQFRSEESLFLQYGQTVFSIAVSCVWIFLLLCYNYYVNISKIKVRLFHLGIFLCSCLLRKKKWQPDPFFLGGFFCKHEYPTTLFLPTVW